MIERRSLLLLVFLFFSLVGESQELNARVNVVFNQISTTVDRRVFKTLQTALTDFLSKRKWTPDDYSVQEKISCNFLLNLQSSPETNVYKATLTVQAARPVYNSSYQAALINFQDADVAFRYVEFQPIEFNENRVQGTDPLAANLTAIFAYYVNMILGLDNASFSPRGGDVYFRKANAIVNAAPDGRNITGWRPFDGQRNRYWLAENLVNSRYSLIHDAIYGYYRQGLDHLTENESKARQEVLNSLSLLYTLHEENPNIMIYQFYFQGKSEELINLMKKANPGERARAVEILQKIDVTNAARYKEALK
jgi:hypothetical protein